MHFCGFTIIIALCFSAARPLQGRLTVAGAPVQPCQAPMQWEGRIVEYDHSTGLNTRAMVSYDGLNQQIRVLEEKRGHVPCKKYFEYIYLFKSAVLFQIEQVTKLCSKIPLTEAWDPYDIPDNSTYEDQYIIGGPGDMIQVQEWLPNVVCPFLYDKCDSYRPVFPYLTLGDPQTVHQELEGSKKYGLSGWELRESKNMLLSVLVYRGYSVPDSTAISDRLTRITKGFCVSQPYMSTARPITISPKTVPTYLDDPYDVSARLVKGSLATHEAWVGVYTVKDCYPVQETYTKNSSVTTSTRFFDLQLGISDPSVFTPPETCRSAQAQRMTQGC